jgi:hypothetical protein
MRTIERRTYGSACPPAEALIREARQRQRKRRLVIAVTSTAITAVALTVAGIGGAGPARRSGNDDRLAPGAAAQTLRVDWRSKVASGTVSVILADGSLWIAGFGAVARMDPVTGRLVARISTPRTRELTDVVSFGGRIWVSSGGFGDSTGTLYEIDPSGSKVARTFAVPGQPSAMAGGAGLLWVDVFGRDGDALQPFDPRTGRFLPEVVGSFQGVGRPAFGLGAVWVTSDGEQVWRIDPRTMRALAFWPRPSAAGQQTSSLGQPGQVTTSGGSVWIVFGTEIGRFDPATGRLERTLAVHHAEGVDLQPAGSVLWMLMRTGSTSPDIYLPDPRQPGRVGRIDPRTTGFAGPPAAIGFSAGYDSLAASETLAWVADFANSTITAVTSAPPA